MNKMTAVSFLFFFLFFITKPILAQENCPTTPQVKALENLRKEIKRLKNRIWKLEKKSKETAVKEKLPVAVKVEKPLTALAVVSEQKKGKEEDATFKRDKLIILVLIIILLFLLMVAFVYRLLKSESSSFEKKISELIKQMAQDISDKNEEITSLKNNKASSTQNNVIYNFVTLEINRGCTTNEINSSTHSQISNNGVNNGKKS